MNKMIEDKGEFIDLMALWRNEGLTPIANIIGFSKILLHDLSEELSEEHLESLNLIHKNGVQAAKSWNVSSLFTKLRYETSPLQFQAVDLHDVIYKSLADLQELVVFENINVIFPNNLPMVKSNPLVEFVFTYLLDSIEYRTYLNNNQLTILIRVADLENITVRFQAEHVVLKDSDHERFFYPGSPQSVAKLIIQKHNREIRIFNRNQETIIEFELPIWYGSIPNGEAI